MSLITNDLGRLPSINFFKEDGTMLRSMTERTGYSDREYEFSTANKEVNLKAYEKYVWIYAATYAIASSAARTPLRIYQLQSNQQRGDEILEGRLWELFNRPNPFQSGYDLIESCMSSLELTGDMYLEKGGPSKMPVQLYVLRPDQVEIIPDPKQLVLRYDYKVANSGKIISFTPEEVCHIKYYSPRSELYGTSAIQPSTNSLVLDYYTIAYQKQFFKQGGMINSWISVPGALGPKEFSRFKEEVRSMYSGVANSHVLGVFDKGADVKAINQDPSKLLLTEQRKLNRDEILAAFGVPPIMVGLLDSATYANTEQQLKAFWSNTMLPKLKKLEDRFNREFMWPWNCECQFDVSGVDALKTDNATLATMAGGLVAGSVMTPNEVRERYYQLPPVTGGEQLKPVAVMQPVMAMSSFTTQTGTTSVQPKELSKKELLLKAHNENMDKVVTRYEKRLNPIINMISLRCQHLVPDIIKSELTDSVDNIFDSEYKNLEKALNGLNQETVKEQFAKAYGSVKTPPTAAELNTMIERQIGDDVNKWAKASTSSVVDTMKGRVKDVLQNAQKTGQSLDETTKQLQEVFKGTEREAEPWARKIARTESSKAVNTAKMEGYKAAGVTKKQWISPNDASARPDHIKFDSMGPQDIDFVYKSQHGDISYPGDPSADVSDLVNCRCTVINTVEE